MDEKINKIFDLTPILEQKKKDFDVNDPEYKEFMEEAITTFNKLKDEDFQYDCWEDDRL